MKLRFAILRHDGIDQPHFDLLFESAPGSDLATWRSNEWPITGQTELKRLKNHRRAFLTYEGTLTDDRGQVSRIDDGEFELLEAGESLWRLLLPTGRELHIQHLHDNAWRAWQ